MNSRYDTRKVLELKFGKKESFEERDERLCVVEKVRGRDYMLNEIKNSFETVAVVEVIERIYTDVICYRYRDDKKAESFRKYWHFQRRRINSSVNKLNEVRNYRYAMKTFDEKYWHFENRVKHGISVAGSKFLIRRISKTSLHLLDKLKFEQRRKCLYRISFFDSLMHREKMFNKVKVQDNFESLLIGLRDEFNDRILTIFSFFRYF